jgi:hypothetical protein
VDNMKRGVPFGGPPSNDTFLSQFRSTKSRVAVRQGAVENFRPEIYVTPNSEAPGNEVLEGLRTKIGSPTTNLRGVGIEDRAGASRFRNDIEWGTKSILLR